MLKKHSSFIAVTILALFLIVSLIVSSQESTTMDEQAHIPAGYTYVKYNDMRLNPEHPPLLKDLAGVPLLFLDVNFPTDTQEWKEGINEQWVLGNQFIHMNNADQITFWSRFLMIFVALILGIFIFKWSKELAGTAAGLLGLALFAFDPNFLGHSHYVTTDVGIAAAIFISFYFFIKFIKKPNFKNVVLAGAFLGVVQLTKFSAVLLFPFFAIILVIYALFKKKPELDDRSNFKFHWAKFWEYVLKYALIIVITFILIWALYLYNTYNMPAEKIQDVANTVFGDEGSGALAKSTVISMSSIPLLKGLSEYFMGVFMVMVRVSGGNTYYFLGEVANTATPSYFPVVFLLKSTLPLLILMIFALVYSIIQLVRNYLSQQGSAVKRLWQIISSYLRTGVAQYSMFGFILFYIYLSVTSNLNIGFRHLFPILPFAYVLVSKKFFEFLKNVTDTTSKKLWGTIFTMLLIWIIIIPIINFPSYLSYFNELVGGPKEGYKYVTDSNLDWGQDLKRLRNWVDEYNDCAQLECCYLSNLEVRKDCNNCYLADSCYKKHRSATEDKLINKIRIDYFGGSNPAYYFGDKYIPWHAYNDPEPGWYAISVIFMQESIYKEKAPGEKSYQWLLNYQPADRVGDSIFIYYVPEEK